MYNIRDMYYNDNELTLLYNKDKSLHKKVFAVGHTLKLPINKQEINTVNFSETLFHKIVAKVGGDVKVLFDKSNPYYQKHLAGNDYTLSEWYQHLMQNKLLLKHPVAMYNDKAMICDTSYRILNIA